MFYQKAQRKPLRFFGAPGRAHLLDSKEPDGIRGETVRAHQAPHRPQRTELLSKTT